MPIMAGIAHWMSILVYGRFDFVSPSSGSVDAEKKTLFLAKERNCQKEAYHLRRAERHPSCPEPRRSRIATLLDITDESEIAEAEKSAESYYNVVESTLNHRLAIATVTSQHSDAPLRLKGKTKDDSHALSCWTPGDDYPFSSSC
jgi:hypothetical protein